MRWMWSGTCLLPRTKSFQAFSEVGVEIPSNVGECDVADGTPEREGMGSRED
jgi:hypothetical protein